MSAEDSEDRIQKIQAGLRRCFKAAGHGSVQKIQEALNLGKAYFRTQRRTGRRQDLKIVLRTLDLLGVEPGELFVATLGAVDPVEEFKAEAATLRRQKGTPPILRALARLNKQIAVMKIDLITLDAARDDDPKSVRQHVRKLLPKAHQFQIPGLLGIYASARRSECRLAEAQIVLAHALQLADQYGDEREVGNLLLRCVSLSIDQGQLERSLALAEKAACCYLLEGDQVGLGRAMVTQGIALGYLDRVQQEILAFRRALEYLPPNSDRLDIRRNRFSALLSLAIAHRKLGELTKAGQFAVIAEESSSGVGANLRGKLVWLRGSISKDLGDYLGAEQYFQTALDLYAETSPLSTALVAVDLVRVQLLQREVSKAYFTAQSMAALIRYIESNQVATAAITELIRCALAGRGLTEELLDTLTHKLEKERVRQNCRTQ